MKRHSIALLALVVAGLVVAGSAVARSHQSVAAARTATVLIQHQMHGCHSWSANGGAQGVVKSITLAKGGVVTFTNNDVMPQRLIERSGAAVSYAGNRAMNKAGATLRVTFAKAGTYVFGTKPGEDYMKGIVTTGNDNVLKLVVTVR
jgi:plastocyanin